MLPHIHLVRHGETAWSHDGRHTGVTDLPLTLHGEEQARAVGASLREIEFVRVFTSPLLRARRTCELAGYGTRAEIVPSLSEWNYGDYEGRTLAEIHAERPGWNPFRDGCPHGESPENVSHRADGIVARLRSVGGDVLVFSHGHFLRVLAARWVGSPVVEGRHLLLDPAARCVLGFEHESVEEPAIVRWNAVP